MMLPVRQFQLTRISRNRRSARLLIKLDREEPCRIRAGTLQILPKHLWTNASAIVRFLHRRIARPCVAGSSAPHGREKSVLKKSRAQVSDECPQRRRRGGKRA